MQKPEAIVILTAGIALAVLALMFVISRFVDGRTRAMARRLTRSDSLLSETCMLRYGWRECPALVQLTPHTLYIDGAFFNVHLAVPLAGLTLSKFVDGLGRFTGSNGWIGKFRLHLSAPGLTRALVLGVKRGDEWRRALESQPRT